MLIRVAVFYAILMLTFPFGYYRAYTRKLSARWFFAIHAPVPLVFLMRFSTHLPLTFIPFSIMAFFIGQFSGSRMGNDHLCARLEEPRAPAGPDAGAGSSGAHEL